ncbi:MAG: nuclear transport factor 2 family protein [Pyrinomonadaceae bacterium]
MKRCPTCNKTYSDPSLSFCIDDGTPLITVITPPDETTLVTPAPSEGSQGNQVYKPRDWQPSDYQPPSFQVPPDGSTKRKAWPWVLGILVVVTLGLVGVGIAAVMIVPRFMAGGSNENRSAETVERRSDSNTNSNANVPGSNSNLEDNQEEIGDADDDMAKPPPTDADQVLADLTEMEHEWTVANINADKRQLDRILADDYVGTSSDGKNQGKAEYLRTIERDTNIQEWDFEDLKVNLKGDRATLTGVIKLKLQDREAAFKFTDKFVWREGRWQAVSSEVSRIE